MRPLILGVALALFGAPAAAAANADLSVSASAPGVVAIGDQVTASATVRNRGPAAATAVVLRDALAGPFVFVSATTTKGTCTLSDAIVTCSLGGLHKGASAQVNVTVEALGAGDIRNAFTVRGRRTDLGAANNSAATLTSVPRRDCTLIGTEEDDVLRGTVGDDVICGLGGHDRISGLEGNDTLHGGSGNDRLAGGPGDDDLKGETGKDMVEYTSSTAPVRADLAKGTAFGQGTDALRSVERLSGSRYGDVLRGSRAANVLSGGRGADRLIGGGQRDVLRGGRGRDYLDGGRGRDALYGGSGRDRCRNGLRFSC